MMEKGEEEELLKEFINGDPYLKVKFKEFIKELDKIDIIINNVINILNTVRNYLIEHRNVNYATSVKLDNEFNKLIEKTLKYDRERKTRNRE